MKKILLFGLICLMLLSCRKKCYVCSMTEQSPGYGGFKHPSERICTRKKIDIAKKEREGTYTDTAWYGTTYFVTNYVTSCMDF